MTCAGYPGSYGHETTDAQDFADWGVDYLKYDNCNQVPGTADAQQDYIDRYTAMRDALKATGRPIVYSLCEWGQQSPWEWGGRRRQPVAHHRRHQRQLVEHAVDRRAERAAGRRTPGRATGTTRTCSRSATAA